MANTEGAALDADSLAALVERVRAGRLPPPSARRCIREVAGLSIREMAEALHVTPMTVWRWETGTNPRLVHAIEYRRLLDALQEVER